MIHKGIRHVATVLDAGWGYHGCLWAGVGLETQTALTPLHWIQLSKCAPTQYDDKTLCQRRHRSTPSHATPSHPTETTTPQPAARDPHSALPPKSFPRTHTHTHTARSPLRPFANTPAPCTPHRHHFAHTPALCQPPCTTRTPSRGSPTRSPGNAPYGSSNSSSPGKERPLNRSSPTARSTSASRSASRMCTCTTDRSPGTRNQGARASC